MSPPGEEDSSGLKDFVIIIGPFLSKCLCINLSLKSFSPSHYFFWEFAVLWNFNSKSTPGEYTSGSESRLCEHQVSVRWWSLQTNAHLDPGPTHSYMVCMLHWGSGDSAVSTQDIWSLSCLIIGYNKYPLMFSFTCSLPFNRRSWVSGNTGFLDYFKFTS